MIFEIKHVTTLFDLCEENGASDVQLNFARGHLGLVEAICTFHWKGKIYERTALLDYEGISALEQVTHLAACVFDPRHQAEYGRLLHERRASVTP